MNFQEFSRANLARCLKWHPAGIDSWSPSDWAVAAAGEMGEMCNMIKKLNRIRDELIGNPTGQDTYTSVVIGIGKEIADTVIYLDLVAQRLGIDLQAVVIAKWNEVSERNGFPDRIGQ